MNSCVIGAFIFVNVSIHLRNFVQNLTTEEVVSRFQAKDAFTPRRSLIVKLEVHTILDLVVFQCNVILEDVVPLLQHDLVMSSSRLGCDEFLEIADGVCRVTFDANLLSETIVARYFNHDLGMPLLITLNESTSFVDYSE